MVTIKRVDILSAMKIGALFNALTVTVFGIFFFACNSLAFSAINTSMSQFSAQTGASGFNSSALATASLAGCLITYVIAIVVTGISGAILGAMYAFFYNVISNWAGGLQVELGTLTLESGEKTKKLDSGDEFRF
ncbi:MAG: DUF3566 domain-containing protein [Anaerolineae bacterium]|nr:DUF3566 domain-containing protein [Anaerolineae bacterium]